MQQVRLNVYSRLNLEALIRAQRTDDHDELLLLMDLRNKIGFEDDERASYVTAIPGLPVEIKAAAAKNATVATMDFEKAEIRKLASLVRGMRVSTDDALAWYSDLRKQLIDHGSW